MGKTIVYLKDKNYYRIFKFLNTVNKHIKNGHIVKRLYNEKNNINIVNEYNFYTEYNKPATKGDIALIMQEIAKIREGPITKPWIQFLD